MAEELGRGAMVLTEKGIRLYEKAQVLDSEALIQVTRVVIGSGYVSDDELSTLTELKDPIAVKIDITDRKVLGDGRAYVKFRTPYAAGSYCIRTIGVMANDPDEGEILYCCCSFGDYPQRIENYDGTFPAIQEGIIYFAVGNSGLRVDITEDVHVMPRDFQEHREAAEIDHPDGSVTKTKLSQSLRAEIDGKALSHHSHGNDEITDIDASKIKSGVVDIERLPPAVIERMTKVANRAARLALTKEKVQKGDTVKELDTGLMYMVIDDSKLNSDDGYEIYTAGSASAVPWSGVTGKPNIFPPSEHTHQIDDVEGLNEQLDGKAANKHYHTVNDLSGVFPCDSTTYKASAVFKVTGSGELNGIMVTDISRDLPCMTDGEYVVTNDNSYLGLRSPYLMLKCRSHSGCRTHILTPANFNGENFLKEGAAYIRFYGSSVSSQSPVELLYCSKWFKIIDERDVEDLQKTLDDKVALKADNDKVFKLEKSPFSTADFGELGSESTIFSTMNLNSIYLLKEGLYNLENSDKYLGLNDKFIKLACLKISEDPDNSRVQTNVVHILFSGESQQIYKRNYTIDYQPAPDGAAWTIKCSDWIRTTDERDVEEITARLEYIAGTCVKVNFSAVNTVIVSWYDNGVEYTETALYRSTIFNGLEYYVGVGTNDIDDMHSSVLVSDNMSFSGFSSATYAFSFNGTQFGVTYIKMTATLRELLKKVE